MDKLSVIDRLTGWGLARVGYVRQEWYKLVDSRARELSAQMVVATTAPAEELTLEEQRQAAMSLSWTYAAIRRLAQEFTSARSEIKRIEGEENVSVRDHPQEVLFRHPNPLVDMNFIWQYTISWLQLSGNGYFFLAPQMGNDEVVEEIWPVAADRIAPIPDSKDVLKGYAYRLPSGQYKFIPAKNIVHFMYPNPFALLNGATPLAAAVLPLQTESGTSTYQRDTYVTGRGVPHSILTLPEDMGDRDFLAVSAQIREDFETERKIIIARAGDVKVATVGLSQRDMDLVAQRKFTRDELETIILGFPLTGASGADFKEKYKAFKENTVYPLHKLLAGQLTLQLTQPYYGEQYITEFEDIRAQDRALNVQERNVYWRAATYNEARSDLKKGPVVDNPRLKGLGELPVPLATDPQFILAFYGIGIERLRPGAQQNGRTDRKPSESNASLSESDAPVNQLSDASKAEIAGISVELDRLRKIALKAVESGSNGGLPALRFVSEILPTPLHRTVAGNLFLAKDSESVKAVIETAKADLRGRPGRRDKETAAVNRYQQELEGLYQDWYEEWAVKIDESDDRDAEIALALAALLLLLMKAGRVALPQAVEMAAGKEGQTPEMVRALLTQMESNEQYLRESLIPDLETKLKAGLVDKDIQAAMNAGVGSDAIASLLATATARVGSYAGAWWSVAQIARGLLLDEGGHRILWQKEPGAEHCASCLKYGDQEYESFAELLRITGGISPANGTECLSNCRCRLRRAE